MTSVTSVGWWPCCQMAIPPVQRTADEKDDLENTITVAPSGTLFAFDLLVHASPCVVP